MLREPLLPTKANLLPNVDRDAAHPPASFPEEVHICTCYNDISSKLREIEPEYSETDPDISSKLEAVKTHRTISLCCNGGDSYIFLAKHLRIFHFDLAFYAGSSPISLSRSKVCSTDLMQRAREAKKAGDTKGTCGDMEPTYRSMATLQDFETADRHRKTCT